MSRPRHLTERNARVFEDPGVVACYHHRPPYPVELIRLLASLVDPNAPAILEIGCGLGEIARRLGADVDQVTAADPSPAMLDAARALPGADQVRWIRSTTEELPTIPDQGLMVAAESLHWMDWDAVFDFFRRCLSPRGRLAILTGRRLHGAPWQAELPPLVREYSTMLDFEPFDLIDRLVEEGHLDLEERRLVGPERSWQSIEDYLASWHSRSSLSRTRMGEEAADAFDRAVRALVEPHATDGLLEIATVATVAWGRPTAGPRRGARSPGQTPTR
jgi:SAM-dependent methyltransferase